MQLMDATGQDRRRCPRTAEPGVEATILAASRWRRLGHEAVAGRFSPLGPVGMCSLLIEIIQQPLQFIDQREDCGLSGVTLWFRKRNIGQFTPLQTYGLAHRFDIALELLNSCHCRSLLSAKHRREIWTARARVRPLGFQTETLPSGVVRNPPPEPCQPRRSSASRVMRGSATAAAPVSMLGCVSTCPLLLVALKPGLALNRLYRS